MDIALNKWRPDKMSLRTTPHLPVSAEERRYNDPWCSLRGKAITVCLALAVSGALANYTPDAQAADPGVSRELLIREPLPDFPGRVVTALTIEIAPGTVVGPHRHGGLVYVYLLEGRVRSQLNNEAFREYVAGQSWIEPAGILHSKTENPSNTEPARFLAVIYSKVDATITQPEGE
mgnify:CR=1 FL=1